MTPSAILAAVVAGVAARYPALTVEAHGGQFTERELPMLLAKVPALLVSINGIANLTPYGETGWLGTVQWACYVLGADLPADPGSPPEVPATPAIPRAALAIDAIFDLLTWLPSQRWNLAAARLPDPDSFSADNLYTGHINNLLMFDRPQKTVYRAPFAKLADPTRVTYRHSPEFGRNLVAFDARPTPWRLLKTGRSVLRR